MAFRLKLARTMTVNAFLSVTDAIQSPTLSSHRRYQSPTLSVTDDISHQQLISYHPIG
ncbi:hypothetical protein Q4602_11420 [Paraglaciecola chathamensis]|uniref:hypothetical protein n=1 Tax=Paraglaciecola chathamensis TaxID=368405 RepID=UPI0026FE52E6|nr:hypothetical protein [Paraglaciecola chathamensis]MDO6840080.1 hypothetical protein [Paraglaciecola chathamensis]